MSTRKNARSAHVEIPKVEKFRMREGRKGEAPGGQETPNYAMRRKLFLYTLHKHMPRLFLISSSSSSFSLFLVVHRWRFALLGLCMLVLYGSHEVQDKVMTFSGAEGAFCDGPCFIVGLRIFPKTRSDISQREMKVRSVHLGRRSPG